MSKNFKKNDISRKKQDEELSIYGADSRTKIYSYVPQRTETPSNILKDKNNNDKNNKGKDN